MTGLATIACLLEVTTPKPGNVHRGADFEDVTFGDFALSACAIGPVMDRAASRGVGQTVLDAVQATKRWVVTNTNLGSVLLLAPLAAAPASQNLASAVLQVLSNTTAEDSRLVYQAIRLASPGGLGSVAEGDIGGPAPDNIIVAMSLASKRDLVARQYANGFQELFVHALPWFYECLQDHTLAQAIVHLHLKLMHHFPDSLIMRKCGSDIAAESAARAGQVLSAGEPTSSQYRDQLGELDFWLRSDGHRRNPGTTADFVTATLYVALRQDKLRPPLF